MTRQTVGDEVRSGDLTVEGNVSFAGGTDLTSALAAKGDVAGETWTGTHDFTGATVTGITTGLVPIAPTSIAYSGTSASTTGYVTSFNTVSTLSLNGVFSSDYDSYVLEIHAKGSASLLMRMRSSGSDATGSDYAYFSMHYGWGGTTSSHNHTGDTSWRLGGIAANAGNFVLDLMFPYIGNYTSVTGQGASNDQGEVMEGLYKAGTSFDGFTIYPNSGSMTGRVYVYGLI